MKTSTEIDSKFRFVILAAKRAKQLLRGGKPRLKSKSKNPIRIAQLEVVEGLVHYDLVEPKKEQVSKPEEEGFIGEEIRDKGEVPSIDDEVKAEKKEKEPKEKPEEKLKAEAKKKPKEKRKEKPVEKPKEKPKAKFKGTPRKKAKEIPKKKTKGDKT